jgi:hypothetical protein
MSDPVTMVTVTPWTLLTATAGLIAFHIGLFTLVGRERKSPYMINAIFPVFLLCLAVATLSLLTLLLPISFSNGLLRLSVVVLTLAFGLSFLVVYRTTIRFVYFVDSMNFRHLPWIRQLRRRKTLNSVKPTYTHTSLPIQDDLKVEVIEILSEVGCELSDDEKASPLESIALQITQQRKSSDVLSKLSKAFLSRGYFVQYIAASRHPIEFVEHLKSVTVTPWQDSAKNLIVIDAYSPHFAFIDSIYARKDRDLQALAVKSVTSTMTYAGIHSASSTAFNLFKHGSKDDTRKPTLVIYEGTYALTDLESVEQYRIFARHVIPSEKMWGGMLTVFLESGLSPNDWELLRTYSSVARKIEHQNK